MNQEFMQALEQIEKEKGNKQGSARSNRSGPCFGIQRKTSVLRRTLMVSIMEETRGHKVFSKKKTVVENPDSSLTEISLEDAGVFRRRPTWETSLKSR